jgi:hypothetical protein
MRTIVSGRDAADDLVERNRTGIVVTVFLESRHEPISGWIEFAPQGRRRFAGWLDLASSLAEAKGTVDAGESTNSPESRESHARPSA